jgi:hypothetical protein
MPQIKRIVCLANSRKLSGRCVAGLEIVGEEAGGWVRPVSARLHEEVSEHERQYADGSDPRVLDLIDVPLLWAKPKTFQQENWLIDPASYWVKVGTVSLAELPRFAEAGGPLWLNGSETYHGRNDSIPLVEANSLVSSLKLISVDRVLLRVFQPGQAFGNPKRRVQAQFRFAGVDYALWVTDPLIERAYLARDDGSYEVGASYLTISIGEPYNDACYKLVAAIIPAT